MKFITLSGVDGSGKSTQCSLLRSTLEREGKKVAYFHAIEFSLANRISRFFKNKSSFAPGNEKAVTRASLLSILLREKFLLIDILRFRLLLRTLEKNRYDYLLSDRYFFDSIINLEYLSKKPLFFLPLYSILLPHPHIAFFLDADPERIMRRDRAPEQGLEYLQEKRVLFSSHAASWNMRVIDANQDKQSVFENIFHSL